jgi:hypothetical protein
LGEWYIMFEVSARGQLLFFIYIKKKPKHSPSFLLSMSELKSFDFFSTLVLLLRFGYVDS